LKTAENKTGPHLTPALSPPAAGAERENKSGDAPSSRPSLPMEEKESAGFGRKVIFGVTAVAVGWLGFLACGGWAVLQNNFGVDALTGISLAGFLLGAFVIGVVYHALSKRLARLDKLMPTLSIVGILYVTAMTIAAGNENLRKVGWLLLLACALHNTAGFFLGYWLSRAAGLDKNSARSVAFEVGLQNGGMASGLALAMGKLATVGLAAACFIPWMNISGSVLANYWSKRPAK
jgi:bile acid:Na+ symporter, BASS family